VADYSDRSGFPGGLQAARGAARHLKIPADMKTPEILKTPEMSSSAQAAS
jgi:hypothetical protein